MGFLSILNKFRISIIYYYSDNGDYINHCYLTVLHILYISGQYKEYNFQFTVRKTIERDLSILSIVMCPNEQQNVCEKCV